MTKPCTTTPTKPNSVKQTALKKPTVFDKIRSFYDDIRLRSGVMTDAVEVEVNLMEELAVKTTNLASSANLKGYKFSQLTSSLASLLGIKSALWDAANLKLTKAGAVRKLFQQRLVEARNLMTYATLNKSLPDIKKIYDELANKIPSDKLDLYLHDVIVAGQFRKLKNVVKSPLIDNQLSIRMTTVQQKLVDAGLTPKQTADIFKLAEKVSGNFDQLRYLANRSGLSIETLENGGYFPIQLTSEMNKFVNRLNKTAGVRSKANQIDNVLNKQRNWRTPVLLDPDKTAKLFNMTPEELTQTFLEPGKVKQLLSKLSDDEIDKLIDSGVLSTVPSMSDELLSFVKSVDTGIDDLTDALILNPIQAIEKYTSRLEAELVNNNLFKTLLDEGQELGWLYTKATLPDEANFVKLGNQQDLAKLFGSTNLAEEVSDLYVHKTVAEQMKSLVRLNTSPSELGSFGSAWNSFVKVFNRTLLLSGNLAYLQRVFFNNAITQMASTGSLSTLPVALIDQIRVMKGGLSVLPKTRNIQIGSKTYSLQGLYKELLLKRDTSVASAVSVSKDQLLDPFNMLSAKSLQRMSKFNDLYYKRFGSPLGSKLDFVSELADKSFNSLMSPILFGNQFLDFVSRWATVRDLATTRKWESIDELLAYTDEYYNIQVDAGSIGKSLGSIAPFVGFALTSPGSAIRHFMRHPWQAANVISLYNQMNSQTELSQAEIPDWMLDNGYFVVAHKDQETGKYYSISTGGIDFYLDTASQIRNIGKFLTRATGNKAGSVKDQLESEIDPNKWIGEFFNAAFDKTFVSDVAKSLIGINPNTNRQFGDKQDQLLGIPISAQVKSIIVSTAPILNTIDRNLPDSIAGKSPKIDYLGRELEPGKASWFGVTPTYRPSRTNSNAVIERFTSLLGVRMTEIDPNKQLIKTYGDFGRMLNDVRKTRQDIQSRLAKESGLSPKEKSDLEASRQRMLDIETVLIFNRNRLNLARATGNDRIKVSPMTVEAYRRAESQFINQPFKQEAEMKLLNNYMKEYYGDSSNKTK